MVLEKMSPCLVSDLQKDVQKAQINAFALLKKILVQQSATLVLFQLSNIDLFAHSGL